jgi:hypothetical protein
MNHHDQPKLIAPNVEHRTAAHLIRMGVNLPHVGEGFPRGTFRHADPRPERRFRLRPSLPELPEFLFGDHVHPSRLWFIVVLIQVFSQNAKKSRPIGKAMLKTSKIRSVRGCKRRHPAPWPPKKLELPDTIEAIERGRPAVKALPSALESIRVKRRVEKELNQK